MILYQAKCPKNPNEPSTYCTVKQTMSYLPYYRQNNYSSSRWCFKTQTTRWSINTSWHNQIPWGNRTRLWPPFPSYLYTLLTEFHSSLSHFVSFSLPRPSSVEKNWTWSKYKQDYFSQNPNKHRHFAYCANIVYNIHANAYRSNWSQSCHFSHQVHYSFHWAYFNHNVCNISIESSPFVMLRVQMNVPLKWFDLNVMSQIKYCILIESIEHELQCKLLQYSFAFSIHISSQFFGRIESWDAW